MEGFRTTFVYYAVAYFASDIPSVRVDPKTVKFTLTFDLWKARYTYEYPRYYSSDRNYNIKSVSLFEIQHLTPNSLGVFSCLA